MGFLLDYFFCISIAGTIVLAIFAIMAFCNVDNFQIKSGKNIKSGLIAAVGSAVK